MEYKLLTTNDVATLLGCSTRHVLNLRKHGIIVGVRFGKRWMFPEKHIQTFIEKNLGKDFSNVLLMSETYIKKNFSI